MSAFGSLAAGRLSGSATLGNQVTNLGRKRTLLNLPQAQAISFAESGRQKSPQSPLSRHA